MSIHSQTKRRYVVIVNRKELRRRAKRLGYKNVMLLCDADLRDEDTENIREKLKNTKNPIVLILYCPEKSRFFDALLGDEEIKRLQLLKIDLFGMRINETETVQSLEQALISFPAPENIAIQLFRRGYVFIKGNPFHCGNCYAVMRPGDKYCQHCGTSAGEGAFQSSLNFESTVYLYGPPVKKKYKCPACGHIWITDMRIHPIKHCPECGCPVNEPIQSKTRCEFGFFDAYIGLEEPFEEENRPVLFTEKEVKELIKAKIKQNERSAQQNGAYPWGKMDETVVFDAMRYAGFTIPEIQWNKFGQTYNYPRTEKEDEQILLARRIVWSEGNIPDWNKDMACPHCASCLKAVLDRRVINENGKELENHYHVSAPMDAVKCDGDYMRITDEDMITAPAYLCLCCGTEYGELCFTKEQKERYEKQDQEN